MYTVYNVICGSISKLCSCNNCEQFYEYVWRLDVILYFCESNFLVVNKLISYLILCYRIYNTIINQQYLEKNEITTVTLGFSIAYLSRLSYYSPKHHQKLSHILKSHHDHHRTTANKSSFSTASKLDLFPGNDQLTP